MLHTEAQYIYKITKKYLIGIEFEDGIYSHKDAILHNLIELCKSLKESKLKEKQPIKDGKQLLMFNPQLF